MRRHSKYGVVQDARWCRLSAKRHTCPPARCASAGTGLRRLAVLPPAASQQPKSLCTFHTLIINHSCRVPSTRHADSEAWRQLPRCPRPACVAAARQQAPSRHRRTCCAQSSIRWSTTRPHSARGPSASSTALGVQQAGPASSSHARARSGRSRRRLWRQGRCVGALWARTACAASPASVRPRTPALHAANRATHMATGCGSSLPGAACGAPTAPTLALPFLGLQAVAAEALVAVEVAGASTVSPRALPSVSGWPVAAGGGGGVQAASLELSLLLKVTLCHCLRLTAAHVVLSAVQRWWRRASMCTPARARWCASSQTPW